MLFAQIPLTILAGLALVNGVSGHQLFKRQDTGAPSNAVDLATNIDSAVVASATSALGSLSDSSDSLGTDLSSLLAEATGSDVLGSYLPDATGILGTSLGSEISSLLNGVMGTGKAGSTATGDSSSATGINNAATGATPMGAMSSALLAGFTTVSAGLLAGAWSIL